MISRRLVSIAIPAYKPDYFEAALQSALRQSHDDIEIVICDDCRDDAIYRIVERVRPSSPWPIRYLRNEVPLGETLNVARCIRESCGEYIKFLYDDDLLHEDCVSQLFELLHDHPDIALASSRRRLIDASGELLPDSWATRFPFAHDVIFAGTELVALLGEFTVNFIGEPSCVMCRRVDVAAFGDDLMAINGVSITWVGDIALYVKLLRKGNLAMRVKPLSYFRISPVQYSAQAGKVTGAAQAGLDIFQERVAQMGWSQTLAEYRLVKVATFEARSQFTEVDLYPYFSAIHPSKELAFNLDRWMGGRVISANRQRQIDEYVLNKGDPSVLLIVIDDFRQPDLLTKTLLSVVQHQALSRSLSIAVLSTAAAADNLDQNPFLHWRHSSPAHVTDAINGLLREHDCEWFMCVEAGTRFTTQGISRARIEMANLPRAWGLFGDVLHENAAGELETAFRPDFNLDYLLSYPAGMASHWFFNRQATLDLGGFDSNVAQAREFDLILRMIENDGMAELHHIAEPVLISSAPSALHNPDQIRTLKRHLDVRGYINSEVLETSAGHLRITYNVSARPLVSILIPTKDQLRLLSRCVESILEKTAYPDYEIIIIDNNSGEADAVEWLAGIDSMHSDKVRVLRHPFPFNYSQINNVAVREARGEYLVLLNNDTAVLHAEWLDNLLNHALRPEVGIVGAKLYFPDSAIQHAGVVLGLDPPAAHVFIGEHPDSPGYMDRLLVDQNYSAVTAACLMISKPLYEAVGGLDDVDFKVSYNDVDLCLKVREAGYLVVWTPHVRLLHESSVSQVQTDKTAYEQKLIRFRGEQRAMYQKWLPTLASDPAYNRNLALTGRGFEVEPNVDLTWRPLPWRAQPLVLVHRVLRWNEGDQRVTTPLNALRQLDMIDGAVSPRLLHIVEVERLHPDVIVFQQPFTDAELHNIDLIREFSPARRVLDLDRLPANHHDDPLFLCTLEAVDRIVVSSSRLAKALHGMHSDVRVVPDFLPQVWRDVRAERNASVKPRVGWRGDHDQLDLELLAELMPSLADEVDFVVMGWCPFELRPFVSDCRDHALPDTHPAALASMNLDIALLPLREQGMQPCQSLSRLLEFGACAFPVLCSESACGEGTLPVTRLHREAEAWIRAIRAQIADRARLASQGDALQQEIFRHWLLDEANLRTWTDAWLS